MDSIGGNNNNNNNNNHDESSLTSHHQISPIPIDTNTTKSLEMVFLSSKTNEVNKNDPNNPNDQIACVDKSYDEMMLNKFLGAVEQSHVTHDIIKDSEILRNGVGEKRKGKLLVLDLNGILADIVCVVPKGYKPDKKFKGKSVFKRPFGDDFLKFCLERFDVGVWSSRTKKNVDDLVDFLMGDMKHHLLFCWNSSHCTKTGFNTIENRHKPLVLKELKKLWNKQDPDLPWEYGFYNESNTLLLDDSPYKALRNPSHTAVFPCSYRFYDQNNNSLGLGGDIRVYLEGLAMAKDVQEYVEQQPFGQSEINVSMGFYSKVICVGNYEIESSGSCSNHKK